MELNFVFYRGVKIFLRILQPTIRYENMRNLSTSYTCVNIFMIGYAVKYMG